VGVHRALGRARGAGGVGEEGDVVRSVADRWRPLPAEALDELQQVRGAVRRRPHRLGERPRVVARLEVQLGRGDHGADVGAAHDRRRDVAIEALQADEHARAGVLQQQVELPLAVHRVDRHRDAARFPRADQPDDELGHVLQVHRHAVAALQAAVDQRGPERVGELVELAVGGAPVEVADGVPVGVARHARGEHRQRVGELRRDVVRLPFPVEVQPRTFVVHAHQRMAIGLTGAPVPATTLSGAAT
jgi:hypothetical protein